ncbi:hypothetical protein J2S65_005202 [Rhodococcus fascians]|nr:hypothetical protein [Rhodococcus fascians]
MHDVAAKPSSLVGVAHYQRFRHRLPTHLTLPGRSACREHDGRCAPTASRREHGPLSRISSTRLPRYPVCASDCTSGALSMRPCSFCG